MSTTFPQISAMMELNQFSERLAKASSLLSGVSDDEVQLATTRAKRSRRSASARFIRSRLRARSELRLRF